MKKEYEQPVMEICTFETEDVITESGDNFGNFWDLI